MKTLWRHENAGIIIFYVSNVMIVNNNKTKVHFVYTPDIMSCASQHTRYRKIMISCGQQNYIGKLICVCNISTKYTKKTLHNPFNLFRDSLPAVMVGLTNQRHQCVCQSGHCWYWLRNSLSNGAFPCTRDQLYHGTQNDNGLPSSWTHDLCSGKRQAARLWP